MSRRIVAALIVAAWTVVPSSAQGLTLSPSGDQGGGIQSGFEAVVAMLESDRPAEAESALRRILAGSDSAAARDLLGIALLRQGKVAEAEEQFRRAVASSPDLLPPRQHLARLLLRQGRIDDALTELRAAARLGPLERELALWLADAELSAGNASRAEVQLESVAERFQSVRALMQLARLQARRGDNRSALETLRRAVEIAPNSGDVLVAQAKVSLTLKAPVDAIRTLEAVRRMHPTDAESGYLLGVARLQVGDLTNAIEALERSLEIEPQRPRALIALGTALNAQKRFAEAREVLRRSRRLDPASAEALAELAEADQGLGELEAAEEHAAQALAREAGHPGALLTLGLIRMTQARYAEARDALLRAVTSDPALAKAHYQLSLAFARLGDRESSKKHLELYRRVRREDDERLLELRNRAGLPMSGMGSS